MTGRLLLVFTAVLLTLTTATLWLSRGERQEPEAAAAIGGGFELTDQNGAILNSDDFRGKYMLVAFGFTHCPDVCPTTLAAYTALMEKLGTRAQEFVPIFITVDPARDTSAVLKTYLANFHPAIVGLTGSEEQIKTVAAEYKAYFARGEAAAGGGYNVDHSSLIYLMGRDGAYITHMAYNAPLEEILATVNAKAP